MASNAMRTVLTAVVTAGFVVAVYESKGYPARLDVDVSSRLGASALNPLGGQPHVGESLEPTGNRAAMATPEEGTPSSAGEGLASEEPQRVVSRYDRSLQQLKQENQRVKQEKQALESELSGLEDELDERDRYLFEPTPEEWRRLSESGNINYRVPCPRPMDTDWTTPPAELERLGLSPDDGDVLTEAHRRSNQRLWTTLKPLCVQALGSDDVADVLGLGGCLNTMEKLAWQEDAAAVLDARMRVGEVRAGVRPAPEASPEDHPLLTAYLALTDEARRFEADLAESFGPSDAQQIWRGMTCVMATAPVVEP